MNNVDIAEAYYTAVGEKNLVSVEKYLYQIYKISCSLAASKRLILTIVKGIVLT